MAATEEEEIPSPSFGRRLLSIISIEPAIFLASLGFGLQSVISQVRVILSFDMINKGLSDKLNSDTFTQIDFTYLL